MNLIESLESALSTVPTADNIQPWSYRVHDLHDCKEISIYHNGKIVKNAPDKSSVGSLLGLGIVLETIDLTAKAQGYSSSVLLNVTHSDLELNEIVMVARVSLTLMASAQNPELYANLFSRETNRGLFDSAQLPFQIINDLGELSIHIVSQSKWHIFKYLYQTELMSWKKTQIIKSILNWTRAQPVMAAFRNGLNIEGLGLNNFEKALMTFFRRHQGILDSCGTLLGALGLFPLLQRQVKNAAAFGCITVMDRNEQSLIQAGRRVLRCWLILDQHNLGFHPYCAGTFAIYNNHAGNSLSGIKKIFSINNNEIPVMIFRTGQVSRLKETQKALKRKVKINRVQDSTANIELLNN